MSFRWPSKDPDETLDYSVDWSRFLDTATINSVIWFVKSNTYNVKTQLNAGQNLTNASSSAVTDTIQNVSQTNMQNPDINKRIGDSTSGIHRSEERSC